MKLKDRIKTYNFWVALSAAILILVNTLGQAFGFKIDNVLVNSIIMSVCGVLVVLGFVTPQKETGGTVTDKVDTEKVDTDKVDTIKTNEEISDDNKEKNIEEKLENEITKEDEKITNEK